MHYVLKLKLEDVFGIFKLLNFLFCDINVILHQPLVLFSLLKDHCFSDETLQPEFTPLQKCLILYEKLIVWIHNMNIEEVSNKCEIIIISLKLKIESAFVMGTKYEWRQHYLRTNFTENL